MTTEVILFCDCGCSHTKHLPEHLGGVFILGECQDCPCCRFASEGSKEEKPAS